MTTPNAPRAGLPNPMPEVPSYVTTSSSMAKRLWLIAALTAVAGAQIFYASSTSTPVPAPAQKIIPRPSADAKTAEIPLAITPPQPVAETAPGTSHFVSPPGMPALPATRTPSDWEEFKERLLGHANATYALSRLKHYQVEQFVYWVEERGGRGPSFAALTDLSFEASPTHGYFFSEVTQTETGEPLPLHERAGLCTYPELAGANRPVYCMTLDTRKPSTRGPEWLVYKADSRRVPGPIHRWPQPGSEFEAMRQYTPGEGLEQARQVIRQSGLPNAAALAETKATTDQLKPGEVRPLLNNVLRALQWYRAEQGRFPDDANGLGFLTEPSCPVRLEPSALQDPWGKPLIYHRYKTTGKKADEEAEVLSSGRDGVLGNSDDIRVTSEIDYEKMMRPKSIDDF